MENKNENNTSLISIGSTDLVRVSNSISVTNKLLTESKFEFYGDFKGTMDSKITSLNNGHISYSFIYESNDSMFLLYETGEAILVDLKNFEIIKRIQTIKEYIISNKITDWIGGRVSFYQASLSDSDIYIARGDHRLVHYNIVKDSVNEISLSKVDDYSWTESYLGFFLYDGRIFSPTVSHPPLEELEQDRESEKYSISVFSQENFNRIKSLPGFDISFDNLTVCNNYLFAINEVGVKDFAGQLLKYNILTGEYKFISLFTESWIDDFIVIDNSNIVGYSSLYQDEVLVSKLFILDGIEEKIVKCIEYNTAIRHLTVSTCKKNVGILFESGLVKIIDLNSFKPIIEFNFEKIIDTDYSTEPIHIWPPHILHIHNGNIYVGHGKELRKYR